MNKNFALIGFIFAIVMTVSAVTQEPVVPNPDHESMLASDDPQLAENKRLVYDFWREVLEAGHLDRAEKYMTEEYIQHNPNAASGRKAFTDFFTHVMKAEKKPIQPKITYPLVAIVAERDLVVLTFAREYDDPKDASKKYSTTWVDMFRIENGKIAEHWDSALKGGM